VIDFGADTTGAEAAPASCRRPTGYCADQFVGFTYGLSDGELLAGIMEVVSKHDDPPRKD
jgi:hypothetical protein